MVMKSTVGSYVLAMVLGGSVAYARIPPVEKHDNGERQVVTIVTENPHHADNRDELWQQYFKTHAVHIYNEAIDHVLGMEPPELDNPFTDMFGWAGAHNNLVTMLERYVEKGRPLPEVDSWPFSKSTKKYNREMMRRVNADIKKQEHAFKENMK